MNFEKKTKKSCLSALLLRTPPWYPPLYPKTTYPAEKKKISPNYSWIGATIVVFRTPPQSPVEFPFPKFGAGDGNISKDLKNQNVQWQNVQEEKVEKRWQDCDPPFP